MSEVTGSNPDLGGLGDTRFAVYTLPAQGSALKVLADAWLGRDPDIDEPVPHPLIEEISPARLQEITHSPRRYGFHGTLKAPFALAPGVASGELLDWVERFAQGQKSLEVRLKVASLEGFIALVPAEPNQALDRLAAAAVRDLDPFRAPLSDAERARRHPERLSKAERENLERWGYPYVLDTFRYHMTLTERLEEPEHGAVRAVLERLFAPVLAEPWRLSEVALCTQTHEVAPFRVVQRFSFPA
jgi:putative phosphonate metabolism protein